VMEKWKGPDHLDQQCHGVIAFLDKHAPA
jgi:hypothetical protein